MVERYYQKELVHLRELAVEFARAHPALAPMLSGPTQDPDVERLLEGTAFLTGMLREKLDDEFPEVIHGLIQLTFPHYLRPLPATTLIKFAPLPGLRESLNIPAGTELASVAVEGTQCIFRTCYDVEVSPLRITEAVFKQQPGQPARLHLGFELAGLTLAEWQKKSVRLYIAGTYPEAATIRSLFFKHVQRARIWASPGGSSTELPADFQKPVGLGTSEGLFPYPGHAYPGYRLLQEYFLLPEKFLFVDITGLDSWQDRGAGNQFSMEFQFGKLPAVLPAIKRENFVLFASPATNLFSHDADPVNLDHKQTEYRITPGGDDPSHYQVYSVERVTGLAPGTARRREYTPFELFTADEKGMGHYTINRRLSQVRPEAETFLSVVYPPRAGPPTMETLSIELLCTNASLPESLKLGDICRPTATSPDLCEFKNIRAPTLPQQPPLDRNLLWRFLSHLSLNMLSLANRDNLKQLLRLYIFPEGRDRTTIVANQRRIEGITGVEVRTVKRLVSGLPMQGQEILMEVDSSHFAGTGDLYLFGTILDMFLGAYASINSFSHFKMKDSVTGEITTWPVRIGDRPLI